MPSPNESPSINIHSGSYVEALAQMKARIEAFPHDSHHVSFNGEEIDLGPEDIPLFLQLVSVEIALSKRANSKGR